MTVSRPFVSLSVQSQVEMWLLFQMESSFPTAIFRKCCLRAESLPWSNAFIWKYNSNCQFCFLLFYFHHLCVIISGRKCWTVCEQPVPDVWTFTCHLRCWQHHSPTSATTSSRKLALLTNCNKSIKQRGKGILWHFAGDSGMESLVPCPKKGSGICWRPLCSSGSVCLHTVIKVTRQGLVQLGLEAWAQWTGLKPLNLWYPIFGSAEVDSICH